MSKKNIVPTPKRNIFEQVSQYAFPLLIIISLLPYLHTVGFDYVYCDDTDIIIQGYDRISEWSRVGEEFTRSYINSDYYRPLQNISYIFNAQISGKNPDSYHILNIVFHILFICSLFVLINKLGIDGFKSLLFTSMYAVHPLFVNAVVWIPGRNDLMCGLFCILSLIFLIKYEDTKKKSLLLLHSFFLLFAILSKEMGLVFPFVLIMYLIIFQKRKLLAKSNIVYYLIWSVLIILWLILRSISELVTPAYQSGINIFIYNIPAYFEYLGKFLFPIDLSPLATFNTFNTVSGIVVFIILIVLIIKYGSGEVKLLSFGLIWYSALTIPGMVIAFNNHYDWNEYLECRSYLPLVGILFVILKLIQSKSNINSNKIISVVGIVLLIIFGVLNIRESSKYSNAETFYESAVSHNPDRAMFHYLLARVYQKESKPDLAITHMKESVRANPGHSKYSHNLGVYLLNRNNPEEALYYLNIAVNLDTNNLKTYNAIATAYFYRKQMDSAIHYWKIIVKRWDNNSDAALYLVNVYLSLGEIEEAETYTKLLLAKGEKRNELLELYNMLGVNLIKSDESAAVKAWEKCIEIEPYHISANENLLRYYYEYKNDKPKSKIYAQRLLKKGIKLPNDTRSALGLSLDDDY